jgi:hypothetical protein
MHWRAALREAIRCDPSRARRCYGHSRPPTLTKTARKANTDGTEAGYEHFGPQILTDVREPLHFGHFQAQRSFRDAVDAGKAVVHYPQHQVEDEFGSIDLY